MRADAVATQGPAAGPVPADLTSRVALLVPCLVDLCLPEVGVAAVRLLRRFGVGVAVPPGQTCCGLPLFNAGHRRAATRLAARTVRLFSGSDPVVVPSGSCAWMVRSEYPHLLADDPVLGPRAAALAARTYELSQYLAARPTPVPAGRDPGVPRVTYHDSCHLRRGLGVEEAPRALLRRAGVELVELPGAEECCGFGGTFAVRLGEVSGAILERKLARVRATGAAVVTACDAGCLLQLAGGLARAGDRVRARHLAEVLAERWCAP